MSILFRSRKLSLSSCHQQNQLGINEAYTDKAATYLSVHLCSVYLGHGLYVREHTQQQEQFMTLNSR